VEFTVDENDLATSLAKANIGLRTVERVLLQLGRFEAADFDAFYDGVNALPWEICCFKDSRLHVERVRTHESVLSSQSSLQAMAQKAAYDRLMKLNGVKSMPETGNVVAVRVYMENDICTVGVDTSGDALHKRGYRTQAGAAPLKETIAASLLFLSGWNRKYALLDPFCGSGTIAIEAALYALDFAPGLGRRFAFEAMPTSKPQSVLTVREEFEARIRKDVEFSIHASDADPEAIRIARSNAEVAGIEEWIDFSVGKAEDVEPFSEKGYLIANPPYGNRLGTAEESQALYRRLGAMREKFMYSGWGMGFITDIEDFGDYFGERAPTAKRIMNGAEEQWFHWYPAAH
jgi:putative N6-adenine-specific DNA methylase